ncbi:GNAT family N-acetyltransferase [Luteipulveratus mongoliensis]|uniref:Acetyltransferase n=1 Tax=Luteipulveratus mongoliensis TaxID=571913 RepID=A0A0K1JDS4_9MICO|nr:GNAT family N-acetyltransferase [Luteipulveratus mongoliensis]AKU14735.1 acetyltransferase [Luteipulveratus mongoliensis]
MLRFERAVDDKTLEDWRYVHNVVIPTVSLSLDEVRERTQRNHLEVAYLGDVLVGNCTVWPPSEETPAARVIARVLVEHRRQGFGEQLYRRALDRARAMGATTFGSVVLSSNPDGLHFALQHGFVETERYVLPGETIPWIDLQYQDTAVASS